MKPAAKREQVFDLSRYQNKRVSVKFFGGIEVEGMLEGYDTTLNIVLRDAQILSGCPGEISGGMVLCRGNSVVSVELV